MFFVVETCFAMSFHKKTYITHLTYLKKYDNTSVTGPVAQLDRAKAS